MKPLPSQEELLKRYAYDPFTGNVYHKIQVSHAVRENTLVQNIDQVGYLRTKIKGKNYKLHRIIWKLVYNEEPAIIDHINRIRTDNRISNLRAVDARQNVWNKQLFDNQLVGSHRKKTKNGIVYESYYRHNGKRHYLGKFKTREEAHKRYMEVHNSPCKDFLR